MIIQWPHKGSATANYPAISDVRNAVVYGGGTGSLVVPAASDVRATVTFDNGTLGLFSPVVEAGPTIDAEDDSATIQG